MAQCCQNGMSRLTLALSILFGVHGGYLAGYTVLDDSWMADGSLALLSLEELNKKLVRLHYTKKAY